VAEGLPSIPVSKPLVLFILILGLLSIALAFLIQLVTFGFANVGWLYAIGALLLLSSFTLALAPDGVLRREQVLESWGVLVEGGKGRSEEVLKGAEGFLRESKAPRVQFERRRMAPSVLKWALGVEREFLEVKEGSLSLRPYRIYINARDYGEDLDVSWYLTYRPTLIDALAYLLTLGRFGMKNPSELDLFELQDLRAYTTCAHHCLLKSVEKLLLSLNQDPSKIDRRSRGFLGVS
jgi:hypothetical protein